MAETVQAGREESSSAAQHEAAGLRDGAAEERRETLPESLAGMAYVLVAGLFAITFLFQNYMIPSPSMVGTLLVGDHVLVDRVTLAPETKWMPLVHYRPVQHGDVIVFVKPNSETPDLILVKRAIGLPGDRIHLEHGVLFRNGVRQDEPQISMPANDGDASQAYEPYRDDFPRAADDGAPVTATWAVERPNHVQNGELVVPPGYIFAMGDNRTESLDSRFWGFVPQANIVGRPTFVYWSFVTPNDQIYKTSAAETMSWVGHTIVHFFDQTRWKRTLHLVR